MLNEIALALIQAATEFLPVSSSGHLTLLSSLISKPDIFFFTILHLASLIAVVIFTRKEIVQLFTPSEKAKRLWVFLIVATIPAAAVGYFYSGLVESAFNSLMFVGFAFLFTGIVLISTRNAEKFAKLNAKNAFAIGVAQIAALFPGVSRSGMTISSGMFLGLDREEAARFSFLLMIPLVVGAVILESGEFYFSTSLLVAFFVCLFASLLFLNLLMKVIRSGKFWMFGIYCFVIGLVSLYLHYFI
jgi:undecaprenyl-diphosphatase